MKTVPSETRSLKLHQTLVRSFCITRLLVAAATCAAGIVVLLKFPEGMQRNQGDLILKWKIILVAHLVLTVSLGAAAFRAQRCISTLNENQRRSNIRTLIILLAILGCMELVMGMTAYFDLTAEIPKNLEEAGYSKLQDLESNKVKLLIVMIWSFMLNILEIICIMILVLFGRRLKESATGEAVDSGEKTIFLRKPSTATIDRTSDFSFEEATHPKPNSSVLVINETYDIPSSLKLSDRLKNIPPPLPPIAKEQSEETQNESTPLKDKPVDLSPSAERPSPTTPASPKSPTFTRYVRNSNRGSLRSNKSLFPAYEDTKFAYFDVNKGTFARPNVRFETDNANL